MAGGLAEAVELSVRNPQLRGVRDLANPDPLRKLGWPSLADDG